MTRADILNSVSKAAGVNVRETEKVLDGLQDFLTRETDGTKNGIDKVSKIVGIFHIWNKK